MRIKLTIITIIAAIFIAPYSFADNAKTTTSQGYVDTQIATKQDKVPAVDTNTVITTTNTTGEIGEKSIYDASGNYAEQMDALVTAADANAAVQNAIDTEFVCIEWAPNTAPIPENCYIWQIRATRTSTLHNAYTQLEYLESTGAQYIDTGIHFNLSKNYHIIGKTINPELSKRKVILGSFSVVGASSVGFEFGGSPTYSQYAGHFRVWGGQASSNGSKFTTEALPINTEIKYDAVYDASTNIMNTVIRYDGIIKNIQVSVANIGGTVTNSLRFFKDHRSGGSEIASPVRVGEHRIYEDDILIGHYIPVRRNSDGELGMYDSVSNTFFINQGTGEFIAGPDVNAYMPMAN